MNKDPRQIWTEVFEEEIDVVKRRHLGGEPCEENLVGLAFSGGGIRSATFGLGVLEALKGLGLLRKVDYLSTVSGGGYIGGWLSANCKRAADLKETDWLDPAAKWDASVSHLRRYSNYLSPMVGFFSADTWTMGMVWLRNTVLVQLTVIFALAVALLVPRPLFVAFANWPKVGDWRWTTILLFIAGVVGIAGNQMRVNRHGNVPLLETRKWRLGLCIAAVSSLSALAWAVLRKFHPFSPGPVDVIAAVPVGLLLVVGGFFLMPVAVRVVAAVWRGDDPPERINYTQGWVQGAVVIPMLLVGFLVAAILWGESQPNACFHGLAEMSTFGEFFGTAWRFWPFPLSVVFLSLWVLSFCSIRNWSEREGLIAAVIAPFAAMLVLHMLLSAIMLFLHGLKAAKAEGPWLAYVWGPPMVLYSFAISIVMLIGILGRQSSEDVREWWSRFGAWLGMYGTGWMIINVAAVYGPQWSAMLFDIKHPWQGISASVGWIGTTLAGLFAGGSGKTGGKSEKGAGAKALEVVAAIAPFVFIAGLLVAVSTVLHLVIANVSNLTWNGADGLKTSHWQLLTDSTMSNASVMLGVLGLCLVALMVLAARVDINEFSLNAFYRSRLVRCYLGAARFHPGERNPQKFTGFDELDDLNLSALAAPEGPSSGPFHIVNCALNLGGSSDLALHTRHSAIFTLTPLQSGSRYRSRDQAGNEQELGFVPTNVFGGINGQPSLGQAMAVSGAAASPNMGYHTSSVVAFLLTLFNVRLGWWFPNPAQTGINSPSPWFSLRYLLTELFGEANDKAKYLAISDGGHFENLAGYELVRRKCRVIIISDGGCDPDLHFEDLGTLIRMCEVDFNAKITIDVEAIRSPKKSHWSTNRYAIGSIDYRDGSPEGTLIYLKASMDSHEDTSVLQYKSAHPAFPHESTADQFYGEDQFESYRTLGRDIANTTFGPIGQDADFVASVDSLVDSIRNRGVRWGSLGADKLPE
jgi:hypothetical protein